MPKSYDVNGATPVTLSNASAASESPDKVTIHRKGSYVNNAFDSSHEPGLNGGADGASTKIGNGQDGDDKTKDGESTPDAEVKRPATFAELFSMATALDGFFMSLGFLASLAHGSSWPLLFLVFGDMTNSFISYNATANFSLNGTSPADEFEDVMTDYALRYVYIGIGVYAVTYIHIAFLQLSGERQTYRLRRMFFKALLRQNIGWYDSQQSGELTTRLADDLERVKEGVGDKLGLSLQFLAQFIAGFAFGFAKGWKLTLVIMSMTPLLAFFAGLLGKIMTTYSALEQSKYAKAGAIAEEVLSCIRTVISFNGHPREISRYSAALKESQRLGIKKNVITGLSVGTTMLIMFGAYGLAFWYGSTQVNEYNKSGGDEGLSPGGVFSVFFSVMVGSFALGSASPHIQAVLTAKGSAGTVHSIIKNEPTIDSSDPGGKKPHSVTGNIELRDVTFTYPTRKEVQVLKSFDLTIQAGKTVALVGSSGCGKSTIINLLQRFYDPDQGRITLDGEDLTQLNIHWLRNSIGVVSQEPILFGMSIKENIILGRPGVTDEEIVQAAKMSNAHDFITSLPQGYNTLVGERGAQLSGGQKQRVAIARALVRDPKILLLDEATSALDSEAEGIVQAALDKAREGRTTVVVAHRLSTIQNADLIYVLENGQVVESGVHKDLMERKGAYYHLVMLQTIAANEDEQNLIGEDGNIMPGRKQSLKTNMPRKLSTQQSREGSPMKKPNLFRATSKQNEEEEDEDKDIPRPGFVRMFRSNLPELPYILFGCVGAIANGAVFPVFAIFFSEVFKTFTKTGQELLDQGILWALMYVALGGLSFIANLIQNSAFGVSGERLTTRLRARTFTNILRQDVEYFDDSKHSTGALTTRLATDASMVRTATGIRLAMIVQSVTSMAAGITIAFVFGWKLALVILGMAPIMAISGVLNMAIMKGNQQRDSKLLEAAGKTASECVENIRTVQSLGREPFFYEKYCEQLVKPHKENMKQAQIYGLCYGFSQSVIFFIYAAAFRFGAYLVAHDGMDPDIVFRVFFAIAFTGMSVGQAASFLPDYSKAQLSAGHIFTILDLVPKIDVYSTSGKSKPSKPVSVELQNIQFSYPMRSEVTVLKGVDIHIKAGQTVALVGQSGCGKSTIVSLLQRYYDPTQGSIIIEGLDLKEYNVRSLRSLISVVSQEPVLFNCSIRENIAYGLDTEIPMADIIDAARTANAHDFISEMPQGYDTMVGEKGTQLSGGQKQRVAIARALIRNPKILLLDEATSALDTHSEKVVQAALDKAREGRTCVLIAHRLSTIQNADVIYAMEDGRVMEFGSHQELLAKRGVYFTLVQGQQFNKSD